MLDKHRAKDAPAAWVRGGAGAHGKYNRKSHKERRDWKQKKREILQKGIDEELE